MYCKYCGAQLDANSRECFNCKNSRRQNKTSDMFFLMMLFVGPCLKLIYNILRLVEQCLKVQYIDFADLLWDQLPIGNIIGILLVLVIIKVRKIDTSFCKFSDACVWTILLAMPFFGYMATNEAYYTSLEFPEIYGAEVFCGYIYFNSAQSILTFQTIWYYICMLIFIMVRSQRWVYSKKTFIVTIFSLILWSIVAVVVHSPILLKLIHVSESCYHWASNLLQVSLIFMTVRHVVLLFFAIQFGKGQVGAITGVVGGLVRFLVTVCVVQIGNVLLLGLAETIGYVVFGVIILLGYVIRKNPTINLDVDDERN